jgi:hypothetical protein
MKPFLGSSRGSEQSLDVVSYIFSPPGGNFQGMVVYRWDEVTRK